MSLLLSRLVQFIVILLLACCSVGLGVMGLATGWAWEWNKVCLFGCLMLFNLLCYGLCYGVGLLFGWVGCYGLGYGLGYWLGYWLVLMIGLWVGLGGSPAEGRGQAI